MAYAPVRMQMKDLQGKSNTELRVSDVRYDVEVPDALFDPVLKLSTAASSPVWAKFSRTSNPQPVVKPAPSHTCGYSAA